MKNFLLIACLALSACDDSAPTPARQVLRKQERFEIIQSLYSGSRLYRDNQTGKEYLFNAGGGIQEVEASR